MNGIYVSIHMYYVYIYVYIPVCVYQYIYVPIHMYMNIYIYIHIYVRVYICIYTCVCIYMYIRTHTYVYVYTYIYTYVYIYTCINIYVHTYISIHTYIHVYIHLHINECIHHYIYFYVYIDIYTYISIIIHINISCSNVHAIEISRNRLRTVGEWLCLGNFEYWRWRRPRSFHQWFLWWSRLPRQSLFLHHCLFSLHVHERRVCRGRLHFWCVTTVCLLVLYTFSDATYASFGLSVYKIMHLTVHFVPTYRREPLQWHWQLLHGTPHVTAQPVLRQVVCVKVANRESW